MATQSSAAPPTSPLSTSDSSSFIGRLSQWASENKALVYTIAGVAVVVTGAGVYYYSNGSKPAPSDPITDEKKRASKKERRKAKKEKERAEAAPRETPSTTGTSPKAPSVARVDSDPSEELPTINEDTVDSFSKDERQEYATKLKLAGNKAYGDKRYNEAIDLYSKAILCKPDPIFYSNRAACQNAIGSWEKVVEDTSAALALDSEYIKALNRRAFAYEKMGKYNDALVDYTASCILDQFRNQNAGEQVEALLNKVAKAEAQEIMKTKKKKLPSPTFVTNYLQSFRPRSRPEGLEETAELDEDTGLGQLRLGLAATEKRTGEEYEKAVAAFDKALELGNLGQHEALAYNMRGTFRYLMGDSDESLADLSKAIELRPDDSQGYIKRASMHLESNEKDQAVKDFEMAMEQNKQDPDIYYHRAQLHFILGEYADAARDYQESINLDRDFIFSHIQLGVTQYKMGSVASSMATFRRCIKNFENVPDVYNYYGELLLDQQKYQEAVEKFETAVEMEKKTKPMGMNVLPLINKALALFQWKQDFGEAEKLCKKALIIDPECDIAVATMAQLQLQQGKVTEALDYFRRAADLSRTEGEVINALQYAAATRTQLEVQDKYPKLKEKLEGMNPMGPMR